MTTEQRIYAWCTIGSGVTASILVYVSARLVGSGTPRTLVVGMALAIMMNLVVGYLCWRAWSGHRPVLSHPAALVLKLVSASALIVVFGPRLLSALAR